mmetsp:Transcript_8487/g.14333  ORF Transcript_8487/g.14333 Transcript_8487/m.14333 type:complete len:86 (-) Transcript_8487:45-302(-)
MHAKAQDAAPNQTGRLSSVKLQRVVTCDITSVVVPSPRFVFIAALQLVGFVIRMSLRRAFNHSWERHLGLTYQGPCTMMSPACVK